MAVFISACEKIRDVCWIFRVPCFAAPEQKTVAMIILASGSSARRALLQQAGVKCLAVPADLDEAALKASLPAQEPAALALALAAAKAAAVSSTVPETLVIGADQLLVCEGRRFDKPRDQAEAAAHLRFLAGRTHTLITAICVHRAGAKIWSNVAEARLTMLPLSDAFIESYLEAEGEAVLGCVGVYRLEGRGAQLFTHIEGDFFTILGLNLLPLLGFLREAGALPG
jgi:septum formation protein